MVTGASGLLGRQIMATLKGDSSDSWEVFGLFSSRHHSDPDLIQCDLLAEGEAERLVDKYSPDAVIHSAAERRPDVVFKQPQVARKLNIDVTRNLAEACQKNNTLMIFLSTDYIFDGESPPYAVDAKPHPLSTYGEQKVEGEDIISKTCEAYCVLRVPLLFGPMEYMKESGVTALKMELDKGVKKADHTQKRYPTYTLDVARVLKKMLEVHFFRKQLRGVYHWQANESLTKYDMMVRVAHLLEIPSEEIVASMDPLKFPAPMDSRLDCSKLENELDIGDGAMFRTPFKEALEHSFRSYMATELKAKFKEEDQIKYSLIDLERWLEQSGHTICNEALQKLINTDGEINAADVETLLLQHVGEH